MVEDPRYTGKMTVQYAGVVYFRNQEDAIKAVKILGKRVKSLFD